jgi:hypothetical protein
MIFFLVDYSCHDSQGADKVLNALRIVAQYQIDHTISGVVTYHFSRPSDEEPEKLRFLELYASDKAFWDHSSNLTVSQALMITFNPEIRKSFSWWSFFSEDVEKNVRDTVATLNGIELSPIQEQFNLDSGKGMKGEPVLFIGRFPENIGIISSLESIEAIFSELALYHIVLRDPEGELHLVTLWSTQNTVINALEGVELPELEFQSSQVYNGSDKASSRLINVFEPWNPEYLTEPEAGYCLHPGYE